MCDVIEVVAVAEAGDGNGIGGCVIVVRRSVGHDEEAQASKATFSAVRGGIYAMSMKLYLIHLRLPATAWKCQLMVPILIEAEDVKDEEGVS